ncbi:uncharacterized protein LOC9639528 isoform X1 [Selaginella moellendorffii]|uniref:uncharacterized protein LOC9639528 isoform X1 n=1 Tax=Selaginella moellendorffii TaxID=88036 RepID=UPI000D1CE808|nr:uncharacterized protein LOC9639528 isoform X1 [Selaginella moellendorffii]|eukprot:XP_024520960.1 uncharacterized protein LOC9639528 isoform X1 [Selaginella moellendorffii]
MDREGDGDGGSASGNGAGKKKLLILDVNGLLVDTYFMKEDRPPRLHDAVVGRFLVYRRPHCEEFLQFCLRHFHVAVWSSAKEHNVMGMVNLILGESKKLLAFIWSQKWCTDTGVKCLDNKFKPLFLKELKKVWESSKPDVPWDKGEYGPWNTLLIDDSPHKVLRNPDHTAVLALPYSAMETTTSADDFLPALQGYLTKLIDVPDVRDFVRSNPIGQPLITEDSRDWDFYSKLKLSVKSSKGERWLHIESGSSSRGKGIVESTDPEMDTRQPSSSRRHGTIKRYDQPTGYLKRYGTNTEMDHLTRYETRMYDTDESRKSRSMRRIIISSTRENARGAFSSVRRGSMRRENTSGSNGNTAGSPRGDVEMQATKVTGENDITRVSVIATNGVGIEAE